MKRFWFALLAVTLLGFVGMNLYSQNQPRNQVPGPARSRADETLQMWNEIGNRLVAMAQDFPEDKCDFKVQKDERTFAQNLLHAAALDFVLIRRISGSNFGPDFGQGDNPSRDVFKTKADVVKFVQAAVADGAQVIQQQGDAGLDNTSKFFGNRLGSQLRHLGVRHRAQRRYGHSSYITAPTIWCRPTRDGNAVRFRLGGRSRVTKMSPELAHLPSKPLTSGQHADFVKHHYNQEFSS